MIAARRQIARIASGTRIVRAPHVQTPGRIAPGTGIAQVLLPLMTANHAPVTRADRASHAPLVARIVAGSAIATPLVVAMTVPVMRAVATTVLVLRDAVTTVLIVAADAICRTAAGKPGATTAARVGQMRMLAAIR